MLRNIPGPSFDATLDQVLTQPFDIFGPFFPFSKYAETTSVFSKNLHF